VFLELLKWLKRPEQRSAEFLLLNVIIGDVVNAINTLFIRRQTYLYVNDMFYVYVCVCVCFGQFIWPCVGWQLKFRFRLTKITLLLPTIFRKTQELTKAKSASLKRERDGECERGRQSPPLNCLEAQVLPEAKTPNNYNGCKNRKKNIIYCF